MKNKITKKLLVAMLIAVGYTNLQAQGVDVVDHKGTKNTLNNVTYGYTLAPTTTPKTTKGDIYRKLKGGTGTDKDDVVNSYIYDGRNWVKLNKPELTGTEGSVFFADTDGTPTENNTNFFWDNTNKRLGIGNKAPTQTLDVSTSAKLGNTHIGKRGGTDARADDEIVAIGANMTGGRRVALEFYSSDDYDYKGRRTYNAAIGKDTGTNGNLFIVNSGTGNISFVHNDYSGSNKYLANILPNGNFGINTNNPTEKLEVNGKVKISTIDNLSSIGTNKLVVVGTDGVLKKTAFSPFHDGDFKWSNKTASHPAKGGGTWYICDGTTTGVPDLRARFLRMLPKFNPAPGAWNYELEKKYSSDNRTITIKQQNIPNYTLPTAYTSFAGKHKHTGTTESKTLMVGPFSKKFEKNPNGDLATTRDDSISFSFTTDEAGNHQHSVSVKSGGGGKGIKLNVIPGHYTLNLFMYKP